MHAEFYSNSLKGKGFLRDLGREGRIILKHLKE
jgi:hypothetical protein